MESKQPVSLPICLGLVLSDFVWRDFYTGKQTLIGTFNRFGSSTFPCTLPMLGVYCALSGGRGKVQIGLRIVDTADPNEEPLMANTGEAQFTDPRGVIEAGFNFQNVVFPQAGEYSVQLRCAGQVLAERR